MPFVSIPTTSLSQRSANAHFCSIHQVLLSSSSIRTKSRGLVIPIYSSRASSSSDLVAEWLTRLLLCIECLVGLEAECSPFDSGSGQCVFRVCHFVSIPTSFTRRSANAHFCSTYQLPLLSTKPRGLVIQIYSSRASSSSDLVAEWSTRLLLYVIDGLCLRMFLVRFGVRSYATICFECHFY